MIPLAQIPFSATIAAVSNYNGKDISCFNAADGIMAFLVLA